MRDDVVPRAKPEHGAPARSAHVSALVGDETEKPRSGIAPSTQLRELAPAFERGILDCVFGRFTISQHHVGKLVGRLQHRSQEPVKGGLIAAPRPSHQAPSNTPPPRTPLLLFATPHPRPPN